MRLTILDHGRVGVIGVAGVLLLASLPLVVLPQSGDPFQAPRLLVGGLAAAAIAITSPPSHRAQRTRWGRVAAAAAIVYLLLAVAATVANHPSSSLWGVQGRFHGTLSIVALMLIGVAGWLSSRRLLAPLAVALAVTSLGQALLMATQLAANQVPGGSFGNRAIAGAWLAVATTVTVATVVLSPQGRTRALSGIGMALGALALGMTGTRGAWVGLVAGTLVVITAAGPRHRSLILGVTSLVATLVVSGALLGGESVAKMSPTSLVRGSAASRLEIWRGSVALIEAHPALGTGPGRFLYEFPRFEPERHALVEGPGVRADDPHSNVIRAATDMGVGGAIAFGVLAITAVGAGLKATRRRDAVGLIATAGLVAYLAQGLFGVPAVETDALGWLLGGIALRSAAPSVAQPRPSRRTSIIVAALCICVCAATALYLAGNAYYARGVAAFERGDIAGARAALVKAVAIDPLTDSYRVAVADTALYGETADTESALVMVAEGLRREPRSFDLALARARLLRSAGGQAAVVAAAYEDAVALYPLDGIARREAVEALAAAGDTQGARRMARDPLRATPGDERAPGAEE